ncbi:hypothetical protein BDW60DRAFT_212141 [Aspergillus nidulans var. acristatus]
MSGSNPFRLKKSGGDAPFPPLPSHHSAHQYQSHFTPSISSHSTATDPTSLSSSSNAVIATEQADFPLPSAGAPLPTANALGLDDPETSDDHSDSDPFGQDSNVSDDDVERPPTPVNPVVALYPQETVGLSRPSVSSQASTTTAGAYREQPPTTAASHVNIAVVGELRGPTDISSSIASSLSSVSLEKTSSDNSGNERRPYSEQCIDCVANHACQSYKSGFFPWLFPGASGFSSNVAGEYRLFWYIVEPCVTGRWSKTQSIPTQATTHSAVESTAWSDETVQVYALETVLFPVFCTPLYLIDSKNDPPIHEEANSKLGPQAENLAPAEESKKSGLGVQSNPWTTSKRASLIHQLPPPPPPRRTRVTNHNSDNNQRSSVASEHRADQPENFVPHPSNAKDILADLSRLQKEVDDLRGHYENRGAR